jgi:hypothetical protein
MLLLVLPFLKFGQQSLQSLNGERIVSQIPKPSGLLDLGAQLAG